MAFVIALQMPKRVFLQALSAIAFSASLAAQVLVVDRGRENGPEGWLSAPCAEIDGGFLGDDFQIGTPGDTWFIDRIRTWAWFPVDAGTGQSLVPEKISLLGGIAGNPSVPGEPDCACHGLTVLKTATLRAPAPPQFENPDVVLSPDGGRAKYQENGKVYQLWEVEFRNLRWAAPGGIRIQFAITAGSRTSTSVGDCHYRISPRRDNRRLRLFDRDRKLKSWYGQEGIAVDIQVWARLLAAVNVRRQENALLVTLRGRRSFDVNQVDPDSLRLDGNGPAPAAAIKDIDDDGLDDLLLRFPRIGELLPQAPACLTGLQRDRTPFEGCGLAEPAQEKLVRDRKTTGAQ